MKEDSLPTVQDLKDIKAEIKERGQKQGLQEIDLRGWPDLFPGGVDSGWGHMKWRFERWFWGKLITTGRKARRVSGKGWMLFVSIIVVGISAYAMSSNPWFEDFDVTLVGLYILSFIIEYFVIERNHYVGGLEQVEAGEMIPIAYEKDDTGRYNYKFTRAKQTYTDMFRIPEEALDFLMMYGVADLRDSNNRQAFRFKTHYHNVAWGNLQYADLDTDEFHVIAPQVTIFPAEIDRALTWFNHQVKRDDLNEEEREYIIRMVKEMYAASQIIDENERELVEILGKRFVKIKRNRTTEAFFLSWENSLLEMDRIKKIALEKIRGDKGNHIGSINRARLAQLEYSNLPQILKEKEIEVTKKVATEIEAFNVGTPRDTSEQILAGREPVSAAAKSTQENEFDLEMKKLIKRKMFDDDGNGE